MFAQQADNVPSVLSVQQEKQKIAIAKARHSVVNVKAYDTKKIGAIEKVGSGVIINRRGFVVTNSHVVSGFSTIEVGMLINSSVNYFSATLVVDNKSEDLALLQIDEGQNQTGRFIPIIFANSPEYMVGDPILVIGNPYGYNHSVTNGIISKGKRTVKIGGIFYRDMIQTDASINQGNSGGAVINMDGELLGITTAIFSVTESSNGIGFAIPSTRVQKFIDASVGHLKRGALFDLKATKVAQVTEKETINLNAPVPHKFLGDCTKCHLLAFKTPITPQERIPHPMMGACTKCHDIVTKKPGALAAVAQTNLMDPSMMNPMSDPMMNKVMKDYFKDKKRNNYRLPMKQLILYTAILLIVMATGVGVYVDVRRKKDKSKGNIING
ncbi:MAG: trypsin-like peptidase domain-containing protein [Oligoflexia bacterium]|nr:trypsin-like peptidase domain-containing protein [Oligoflexia bacterium]